ncbi:MAG: ATP-dependent Clp protease ATP-binding subunit [Anaerolineae bacterium]|jgi:ATP-dependent Clp protease ATP-binding subunit ClpC|nr:ATP-dependent Clp protease ATP-binding subunit [Anaerolineae bacterium]MDH7473405.1 ATP-dependent Clp protease ATP-binding subunit [Anaerolineae bacterium]
MNWELMDMGTLNPNILSEELNRALNAAAELMSTMRKRMLTPEILLLTLVRWPECAAGRVLARFAETRGFKLADLEKEAESQTLAREGRDADFYFRTGDGREVPMSDEMVIILDEGKAIAQAMDEVWVGTEHVLGAMSQSGVSTAGLLRRFGVTQQAMTDLLSDQALARRTTTHDRVALARQGQATPVYYREDLLRDLISLLTLTTDRHVILVGPAGVGKRSLVHSLALLIAEGKGPAGMQSVVEIAEPALLDNATAAVQAGLRQARGGVLFIPNIHRFFGGPVYADFPQASKTLQKAFLSDQATIVGTATEADYEARLRGDAVVAEHSHVLRVPPANLDETVAILETVKGQLEADYQLQITDESLHTAATLAQRYLASAPLPGAAVHLMHRTCALVRMAAQSQLAFRPDLAADAVLDTDDVTLAVSLISGVPVSKLGSDERTRYARMVEYLHQRIIGQEEAVLAVSRAVKTARVGLKDPKRPIGCFLFLGPTGVGKTELTKALADFLFGSEEALIALDMSEYQKDDAVNRLIGAPPGYVGYESGGQLTDRVRQSPYTVVLFDEAEKAHPRVLDVLLQVMEEGRLTDGQGRTASFSETVIILTSNLGAEYLADPSLGEAGRDLAMSEVKNHFRPEFLNRLDEIVIFHPLSTEQLRAILGLMLKKEAELAAGRGLRLEVSEEARTWLLAQNDHPEWGARPLRRILQRHIREPLADYLLKADPQPGTVVRVGVKDNNLSFET